MGETPLSDNVQAGPFRIGDPLELFYASEASGLIGAISNLGEITNVCKRGYFYYLQFRPRLYCGHEGGHEACRSVATVAAEMDAEAAGRLSNIMSPWLHLQLNHKGMVFPSISRLAPPEWPQWDFERQVDWLERDIVPIDRDERERSHEQ